jgi:lysophospholipase L1-like esterase
MAKKILLVLASLLFTLLLFESVARFFVKPSEDCYGIFLGKKLLPEKITRPGDPSIVEKSSYGGLVVNGRKITLGDIGGILREDSLLRYAPLKNAVSENGWWQSNALGALRRSEVAKAIPLGVKRVITFGESFTQGQGVPMEDSWPSYLEKIGKDREVINFGVAGYSMCQAYLRYKTVAEEVDHNVVLLGFVPSSDLARDVNVYRGFCGWLPIVMPRFEIEGDRLKLIASPYKTAEDFFEDNERGFSDKFRAHLRAHDRLYFLDSYETVPIFRDSILLKLIAFINRYVAYKIFGKPDSEAIRVSKKIFEEMNKDAHQSGAEFVLLILPDPRDVMKYKRSEGYRQGWDRTVSAVVEKDIKYIDLMQELKNAPDNQIDTAYDKAHCGPRMNRLIAELVARELARLHVG